MPRPVPRPLPRGSALVLALVLLGVVTVIGAASVLLASQERVNASSKSKIDFLNACANAAQAKIWAEMTQYGLSYLGSTVQVTPVTLPDGTTVVAPAHYGQLEGTPPSVQSVTFKVESSGGENPMNERDCTNGACGLVPLGQTYGMTALCKDAGGREHEVELAVKFAL
ncbi:MAG TPA: type II secretion system protein [Anaeromyxobacteraceae bacterium]|nr:type II secretion system protein [Anaeromyxobacteraceae bacterium]